ncbi:MAG TPA: Ig-like domain-containing protein, partial [Actinomycetota bacterium]
VEGVQSSDTRFTVTLLGDTVLFAPLPGVTGSLHFTYSVADGHGASMAAAVWVTVRDVPGAPACGDRLLTGSRNVSLTDALGCTDRDGDALSYAIVDGPAHGSVLLSGGEFTYVPADGFLGDDSFTFSASDGTLSSRVATVHMTIVNHAPEAEDVAVATDEDTPASVSLAATDGDGDPVTYEVVSAPAHGTLAGDAPELTYTPDPGWFGADSFTYAASDGTDTSAAATVTVDVAPVNDPAAAGDDAAAGFEDQALVVPVLDNDTAGDGDGEQALTVATVAQPAHGTAFAVAGGLFYAPEANWSGADTLTYTVCDSGAPASCATASVAVDVAPVNDRPTSAAAPLTVEEDAAPATIDLADFAADVETGDGDLAYAVVSAPQHGALTGSGHLLAYDSDDDFAGRDSFTFRVTDRGDPDACLPLPACSPPLTSALRTVTIAVAPVNDPPAVELTAPATLPVGEAAQLAALGTDVDGDLLTYVWSADGGTIVDGGARATLASAVPATVNVTVTVSDGFSEATAGGAVVFEDPDPVVDAGADVAIDEGGTVTLAASFSDLGDEGHTIAVDWGDGSAPGHALDAAHAYADDGVYTVTVRVTDPGGNAGEDTLAVTVANVAPAVDAGADVALDEGSALVSPASFVDPGADTHIVSVDWGDGTPAADVLDAAHVYADDGSYTVTVLVTDDDGGVGEDTRTVTVRNVAPAVEAGPDPAVDEAAPVALAASFADPGAVDTHTVSVDWGDSSAPAGALDASHAYADDGTYTVTVTVTDDDGAAGSDTLQVTVRNVAPTVEAGPDSTLDEGGALALAASLADPGAADTHAISVDWGDGATGDALTDTHRYDDNGTYTVVVTARDDDGGTGSDTLAVTVR